MLRRQREWNCYIMRHFDNFRSGSSNHQTVHLRREGGAVKAQMRSSKSSHKPRFAKNRSIFRTESSWNKHKHLQRSLNIKCFKINLKSNYSQNGNSKEYQHPALFWVLWTNEKGCHGQKNIWKCISGLSSW